MTYSLGVCTQLDKAIIAAQSGAQHIEPAFALTANLEEQAFRHNLDMLRESGLFVDAMNSMLPGDTVLYGSDEQLTTAMELVRRGMERAAILGCKTVVLGSGTARRIPEDMERADAVRRFANVAGRFCEIARPYGIRIAIEPLRAAETNFIHTIADAAEVAALLPDCDNLGVNPDIYHMLEGAESFAALSEAGERMFHVHICAPDRHYPCPEHPAEHNDIYRNFFRALTAASYRGTVSIEGIVKDMNTELPIALDILRTAMHDA